MKPSNRESCERLFEWCFWNESQETPKCARHCSPTANFSIERNLYHLKKSLVQYRRVELLCERLQIRGNAWKFAELQWVSFETTQYNEFQLALCVWAKLSRLLPRFWASRTRRQLTVRPDNKRARFGSRPSTFHICSRPFERNLSVFFFRFKRS